MNCVILGDKYQQGMKSKGCSGLIHINKKLNIISNQYKILKSIFKNIKILYIYGFDNKKFIDFIETSNMDIRTKFNSQYNVYNHAFSLSLAKNCIDNDDLLIIDGYQKLHKNIFKKFDQTRGSTIFIKHNTELNRDDVGCIINKNNVEHFSFDLNNNIYNIYYLEKKYVNALFEILEKNKYHNYFIFELFNKLIDQGLNIRAII